MSPEAQVTQATGTAERAAALQMVARWPRAHRVTVGADKGYDTHDFVGALRELVATLHVAQNTRGRGSAIDARTTRHPGYAISQWKRKRVEEVFGWLKTIGLLHKARHRGEDRVNWMCVFATAVYNLLRMPQPD